jgi:hypothetical protein
MPDRYARFEVPGYTKHELILSDELFAWADEYAAEIGASVEGAIEAALKKYRAERDDDGGVVDDEGL